MVRADAPGVPTEVIQLLALWYRLDHQLIEKPVHEELSTTHTQIGVAIL